jgi:hypothetical protein
MAPRTRPPDCSNVTAFSVGLCWQLNKNTLRGEGVGMSINCGAACRPGVEAHMQGGRQQRHSLHVLGLAFLAARTGLRQHQLRLSR